MCDLHMHVYRYDRAEVMLALFRSIKFQSYAVESQIQTANKTALNSTNVCCCFTLASGLDRLFIEQLRPHSDIQLATC
jgi:hypothetical protein